MQRVRPSCKPKLPLESKSKRPLASMSFISLEGKILSKVRRSIRKIIPTTMERKGPLYEVERILDKSNSLKIKGLPCLYLVQWKGYGPEHDSWEPVANLDACTNLIESFEDNLNRKCSKSSKKVNKAKANGRVGDVNTVLKAIQKNGESDDSNVIKSKTSCRQNNKDTKSKKYVASGDESIDNVKTGLKRPLKNRYVTAKELSLSDSDDSSDDEILYSLNTCHNVTQNKKLKLNDLSLSANSESGEVACSAKHIKSQTKKKNSDKKSSDELIKILEKSHVMVPGTSFQLAILPKGNTTNSIPSKHQRSGVSILKPALDKIGTHAALNNKSKLYLKSPNTQKNNSNTGTLSSTISSAKATAKVPPSTVAELSAKIKGHLIQTVSSVAKKQVSHSDLEDVPRGFNLSSAEKIADIAHHSLPACTFKKPDTPISAFTAVKSFHLSNLLQRPSVSLSGLQGKEDVVPPADSTCMMMDSFIPDIPTATAANTRSSVLPTSPSSLSYKTLVTSLPHHQTAVKKASSTCSRSSNEDDEPAERRLSVRQTESAFRYKDIVVKKCQGYTQVWLFTQTKQKNCFNPQVIQELISVFNSAKYDDSKVILLSSLGNVFCSGVDLYFLQSEPDRRVVARKMLDAIRDLVKTFITFPKPIVVAVNGYTMGLGVALLPLCDIVYASDKASFYLPYSRLAQTPEGCASFTLPNMLGLPMANELLFAGRKITAMEAYQLGLISQVFWPTSMMQEVIPRVQNMALYSVKAMETTKLLIRSHHRTKLELTNETECNMLLDRWSSSEFHRCVTQFLEDENNFVFY